MAGIANKQQIHEKLKRKENFKTSLSESQIIINDEREERDFFLRKTYTAKKNQKKDRQVSAIYGIRTILLTLGGLYTIWKVPPCF